MSSLVEEAATVKALAKLQTGIRLLNSILRSCSLFEVVKPAKKVAVARCGFLTALHPSASLARDGSPGMQSALGKMDSV